MTASRPLHLVERDPEGAAAPDRSLERRRLLLGLDATGDAALDLGAHRAVHGDLSLRLSPPRLRGLLADFDSAGVRGRGGAGFPFADKLRSVQRAGGGRPAVVANGSAGDPLSAKDFVLLTRAPHLVLDGVSLVAQLLGSDAGIVVARADAVAALRRAVAEREDAGVDPLPLLVVPHAVEEVGYAGGEASALCEWLTTGRALPRRKPPRVSEHGVAGRPTLLSNVETFAHVALIARHGPEWFRMEGTEDDPGTMLVTIAGDVARPGVVEVGRGTGIQDVLVRLAEPSDVLQALLVGGAGGSWVPADRAAECSLSDPSLRQVQASIGTGGLYVLGAQRCGLAFSATVARWLARQTTGQCGPCYRGLPAVAELLAALATPAPSAQRARSTLVRIANELFGRGACGLPSATADFVLSAVETFRFELDLHHAGACSGTEPDQRREPPPAAGRDEADADAAYREAAPLRPPVAGGRSAAPPGRTRGHERLAQVVPLALAHTRPPGTRSAARRTRSADLARTPRKPPLS